MQSLLDRCEGREGADAAGAKAAVTHDGEGAKPKDAHVSPAPPTSRPKLGPPTRPHSACGLICMGAYMYGGTGVQVHPPRHTQSACGPHMGACGICMEVG
eukprot:7389443-Prymnesium_polylepis.1